MPDLVRDELVDSIEGFEIAWVEGPGGKRIRVGFAPCATPRGSFIISPGRTEYIEKHAEAVRELVARGFCVLVVDQRGQGMSDRLAANPMAGHIDSFEAAAAHMGAAIAAFHERLPGPRLLLCHSMGGAVGLTGLIEGLLPGVVGAAFSAPMWGLIVPPGASALARGLCAVGQGEAITVTTPTRWAPEPFEGNALTHDQRRFTRNNALFLAEPRLQIGGPTNGWLKAAFDLFDSLGADRLAQVQAPLLVVSGEADQVVDNASHVRVAGLLPHATYRAIPGAKHELLVERDDLRVQFWSHFDAWLPGALAQAEALAQVAAAAAISAPPEPEATAPPPAEPESLPPPPALPKGSDAPASRKPRRRKPQSPE